MLKKHLSPWDLNGGLALLKELENSCKVFYTTYLSCFSSCYKGQEGHWSQREKDKCHREEEILRGSVFMKKKQVPDTERDTNRVWYFGAEGIAVLLRISDGRAFL